MKKIVSIILALIMCMNISAVAFADEPNQNQIKMEIQNNGQLGILDVEDVRTEGPECFCILDQETFCIGDTINNRILKISASGSQMLRQVEEEERILDIITFSENNDIVVLAENTVTLEGVITTAVNDSVMAVEAETETVVLDEELSVRDFSPYHLKVMNGVMSVSYLDDYEVNIGSQNGIQPMAEQGSIPAAYLSQGGFVLATSNGDYYVREYEATPACVEFLGTYNDYDFYYLSEIFFLETGAEYNRYVVAINGEGATKIAVLEDMNFFVPNKHIDIDDNGNVYQLVVNSEKTLIYELALQENEEFLSVTTSNSIDRLLKDQETDSDLIETQAITNTSTLASRCSTMANYSWTYNQANNGNYPSGATKPSYLPSSNKAVTAVPYCMGGAQAPTSLSVGANQTVDYQLPFNTAIGTNYKYAAGNVSSGNYISKTAGVDCSGFVCIVYNVWNSNNKRYSTSGLIASSGPFKTATGAPTYMELYIKSGSHVMICNGDIHYSSGAGVMPIYEASQSYGRVLSRNCNLNTIGSGYSRAILR